MHIIKNSIPLLFIIILLNNITSFNIYRYNEQFIKVRLKINNKESLYTLNKGSKFSDLVNISNIDKKIDISQYSFNDPLFDGQLIELNSNNNHKISINNADVNELISLHGIGIKIANKIIDYREKNNGFKYLEEIKKVNGIGEKKYEEIKEQISL